jgi:hypothetical protein
LKQAGLGDDIASGPDGHTSDWCDWAIAQCEYDIASEKIQILSMVAFSEGPAKAKSRDFNKNEKIMSLVRQKAHGGVAIYNKEDMQEFLQKLCKMYIPNHKKNYRQGAKQVWAPQSRGLCGLLRRSAGAGLY